MLTDIGLPFVYWLRGKAYNFADYLDRWIVMLDPGEEEK